MDSGNSGSMQSSSGGDEEYDSRPESGAAAAFLNPSSCNFGSLSNPNPSFLSHHQNHHQPTTFFDPSSNYLHAFSNSSSLLNLELVGPGSLRSEPNCTEKGHPQGSSSSSQTILAAQGLNHAPFASSSSMQARLVHDNGGRYLAPSNKSNAVKNSKKRTRASRRAPTTVLTTDTSNFRAMVQEFTGIPAPPFSGLPYSRRLDLFGSGSAIKSGQMEPIGPLYPLRPTTHKFQPNPFVTSSSSSMGDAISASAATNNNNNNTITTSINLATGFNSPANNNYHLVSDLGLTKETQNMLNMQQNPALSFLQPPPLNSSHLNVSGFGAKSSQPSFGMPSLEELAMGGHGDSHGHGHDGHVNTSLGGLASGQDQIILSPFDGNYNNSSSQRVITSCKFNYTASSSDFLHDKSLENVSSRPEGTVDSWICPSD